MPYKTKAERNLEKWVTLPEAVAHICSAEKCDEDNARRQLVAVLADGLRVLGPLKWKRESDDKPLSFGSNPTTIPTDTPPLGRDWLKAKIRWKTGRVLDEWGEYKNGKWRVLLLPRLSVGRLWAPSTPSAPTTHAHPASGNVGSIDAHKRGRKPDKGNKIKDLMRKDLRERQLTAQQLHEMTEEALAARYAGSRDTCRKARVTVLSESKIVENAPDRIIDK